MEQRMYEHCGESPPAKANARRHVAHPTVLGKKNIKMNKIINKAYKFLAQNWNKALALISLSGVVIFNFIPNAEDFYKLFIFIGANAVVWTVIEIKSKLDEKDKKQAKYYTNMREARADIIDKIKKELKQSKNIEVSIKIIGGRIRTISDIVREIKDDIVKDRIICNNVKFTLYTLNPTFFSNWSYTNDINNEVIKDKFNEYSIIIPRFKKELENFSNLDKFKEKKIVVEVKYYNFVPHFYAYIIGNSNLFYGFFTWDNNLKDFIGPENSCFYLNRGMAYFNDYYDWITNRIEFINNCNNGN